MKRVAQGLLGVLALTAAVIAGVVVYHQHSSIGAPVAGATEVTVDLDGFSPRAVEVAVGTTVTWRFDDNIEHDVAGDGFRSPRMRHGTWSHTFTEPGTYDYKCSLHPIMRGRVIVTDAPGAAGGLGPQASR